MIDIGILNICDFRILLLLPFNKNNNLFEAMFYNDFTMLNGAQFCIMPKNTTYTVLALKSL